MIIHIIPDIHGQLGKLENALRNLGFVKTRTSWMHPRNEKVFFLGDLIDRGPNNVGVLNTVKNMIEDGVARAVMGNHELNAIHYHATDARTGDGIRARTIGNTAQHQKFLDELPMGETLTTQWIEWMASLPLYYEGSFRAVHACWDQNAINTLIRAFPSGHIPMEHLVLAGLKTSNLHKSIETLTKGPELDLPEGYALTDGEGTTRTKVRAKWWGETPKTWTDVALSVPDINVLPQRDLDENLNVTTYEPNAKPVFFGHYWLEGAPVMQSHNTMCLDYSAGRKGPLVTYKFDDNDTYISLNNITVHTH